MGPIFYEKQLEQGLVANLLRLVLHLSFDVCNDLARHGELVIGGCAPRETYHVGQRFQEYLVHLRQVEH